MMPAAMSRRAQELAAAGIPFVTATVVRVERPASAEAGNAALVHADGTIEGFVGGHCTEHSVRAYALGAIESGEPLLLRVLPFDGDGERSADEHDVAPCAGAATVQNPCLSGGSIEIFLEPVVRSPRLLVEGDTPIARELRRLGAEIGLEVLAVGSEGFEPRSGDLALVAAGHGRDELGALRRALAARLPYVGLVASRRRGAGVIAELRGDGVPDHQLDAIDTPAGLDIGAHTPSEIALSILARVVAVRRAAPGAARSAVDVTAE